MPVAFRLYLPDVWAKDSKRRVDAGVPEEVEFQTKPQMALAQIRRARGRGVPAGLRGDGLDHCRRGSMSIAV